jgi:hypothetical protein
MGVRDGAERKSQRLQGRGRGAPLTKSMGLARVPVVDEGGHGPGKVGGVEDRAAGHPCKCTSGLRVTGGCWGVEERRGRLEERGAVEVLEGGSPVPEERSPAHGDDQSGPKGVAEEVGLVGEANLTARLAVARQEAACSAAVCGGLQAAEERRGGDGTRLQLSCLEQEVARTVPKKCDPKSMVGDAVGAEGEEAREAGKGGRDGGMEVNDKLSTPAERVPGPGAMVPGPPEEGGWVDGGVCGDGQEPVGSRSPLRRLVLNDAARGREELVQPAGCLVWGEG